MGDDEMAMFKMSRADFEVADRCNRRVRRGAEEERELRQRTESENKW